MNESQKQEKLVHKVKEIGWDQNVKNLIAWRKEGQKFLKYTQTESSDI